MGQPSRDAPGTAFVDTTTMLTAAHALALRPIYAKHHLRASRRSLTTSDGSCAAVKPVKRRKLGEESSAKRTSKCTAFPDVSVALTTVIEFAKNSSPGLAPAAVANTAVFTAGFSVLRLGLTLAGIAHSWVLGTVRIVTRENRR